ncbi:hypothetical protein FIA58_002485 [Flavobacterium jejuense]|uniref:Metal-dependent HD superfamily phosphohydrolase n=1 Tax=Flavobacterium jejuense TaxID=1544455 RepID=A0ABX0IL45_9FLAO|nr:hypothetical protein [Flavobacterium jejuense]NHN24532.1 hypothetical protein [Flavobacterium jejuense]
MDLYSIYSDLFLTIGFTPSSISKQWQDLKKAYSTKYRRYHNLTHIEAMIDSFTSYKEYLEHPNEVLYAIFYHDIIYKTTRKDNELKSAEYALKILPENIILDKILVYDMICATQLHQHNSIQDVNWLIDFDLKILASDWKEYQMYCQQIRKEYNIYPDLLYKPGRKKALEHFLENDFIFQTEAFRTQYEDKARENIKQEINQL